MNHIDRRRALISTAGLAACGMAGARLLPEEILLRDRRPARSRVAILSSTEYSEELADSLTRALRMFRLDIRDKSVLLKPNLVEYIAEVEVNTNPVLVSAAAEAFRRLGVRSVVVAEGPGHQRDTYLVLSESGLEAQLRRQKTCLRRSQPRRTDQSGHSGELHDARSSVASSDRTCVRLRRIHA